MIGKLTAELEIDFCSLIELRHVDPFVLGVRLRDIARTEYDRRHADAGES